MAAVRTPKGAPIKKGLDSNQNNSSPARRTPAWGPNRGSPSPGPQFNANTGSGRGAGVANGFPPLGSQANGKALPGSWGAVEDKQQLLANLAGSINSVIVVSLRSNTRYEGILTTVSPSASNEASLTLKNAKDLSNLQSPVKDTVKISASDVISFTPGSSNATNGINKGQDTFRTDGEISRQTQGQLKIERELQPWQPDAPASDAASALNLTLNAGNAMQGTKHTDDLTFGPTSGPGGSWDQFSANEKLFGVKTHFNENDYTTVLDRNAKDFKEREKRAEQLAAEITGTVVTNPHIAEERNLSVDDSGVNEEDKYSTVVRSANAYVPPGARRFNSGNAVPITTTEQDVDADKQGEIPKVAVNGPEGVDKVLRTSPSPASAIAAKQPPADALPAFRDFVTNEKQRLVQKKQALVKNEMEKRVADLVKFSQTFKLNKPIPEDLVPILAKDEDKQKAIREKTEKDAKSAQARSIGISASILNASQTQKGVGTVISAKQNDVSRKSIVPQPAMPKSSSNVPVSKSSNAMVTATVTSASSTISSKMPASKTVPKITMSIQSIPPFRGSKKAGSGEGKATVTGTATSSQPLSPTSAQRLNVNASAFRPNPKAATFTPVTSNGPSPSTSVVPQKPKAESTPTMPNPFFGSQGIKKTPPVNVKDDFNPFKHSKQVEASQVGPNWPYNGKRYMQMFPPPPVPPPHQASPHMAPQGPVPPPPPSYDEDAAQQAASRGYAFYYPHYAYPGQPPHQQMMSAGIPGMPPGAFVPSPYMQHMPYPPSMPPPNGQPMYAPPHMSQMPPHQQYMGPPPPHGGYAPPPPPNGGGGRPSMPPTPIPAHAHPYYHQSPQLQHAVPYPMMMPPPGPNGQPIPYESGPPPPVPMGGVGHA